MRLDLKVLILLLPGTWCSDFKSCHEKMDFTLQPGQKAQKSFMVATSELFGYAKTDKLTLVRVPYQEEGFYLILAIPTEEGVNVSKFSRSYLSTIERFFTGPASEIGFISLKG